MQNTLTLAHKHIKDLQNQDKIDGNVIDQYYQASFRIINAHLKNFFTQYATDKGLTLDEVSMQANSWDASQLDDAINTILSDGDVSTQLEQRLIKARINAQHGDKRDVMSAIAAAGIAIATNKAGIYASKKFDQQFIDEYNYINPGKYSGNIPTKIQTTNSKFQNIKWAYSDVASNRVSNLITKLCHRGLDVGSLNDLTKTVSTNDKQLGTNNLSSVANKKVNNIKMSFKIGAIFSNNTAKDMTYKGKTQYGQFVTERDSRVCSVCQSYDGIIMPMSQLPVPQLDTHGGCRCDRVACDSDGNLKQVYP